jgi:hypothetical protein
MAKNIKSEENLKEKDEKRKKKASSDTFSKSSSPGEDAWRPTAATQI